ncbi:MAG: prepilin peptidase [Alphaproteobacteria bacterium]|nr:MAG: prepilin peptidase [Alphaproteobacteria bacterium]
MIYHFSDFQLICVLLMTIALTASCVIDLQQKILPDYLTLIVFIIGIILAIYDPIRLYGWQEPFYGFLAGFAGSWIFREAVYRIKGVEAMGLGDVKLFGAVGVWVGMEGVVSAALVGSVLTILVIGLRWLWTRKGSMKDEIPFGPGICAGFLITVLIGPIGRVIFDFYL